MAASRIIRDYMYGVKDQDKTLKHNYNMFMLYKALDQKPYSKLVFQKKMIKDRFIVARAQVDEIYKNARP